MFVPSDSEGFPESKVVLSVVAARDGKSTAATALQPEREKGKKKCYSYRNTFLLLVHDGSPSEREQPGKRTKEDWCAPSTGAPGCRDPVILRKVIT